MGNVPPACQAFATAVSVAQADVKAAQADLAGATGSAKTAAAAAVKAAQNVLAQKTKLLQNCVKTTDVLAHCGSGPDCFYKLPFESDPAWALWTGNIDDPNVNARHPANQPYAFDFVNVAPNGTDGVAGKKILAARPGKVVVAISSEVLSSWKVSTVFVFKGNQYLKFDLGSGVAAGYPRGLHDANSEFKGLPAGWTSIDAAVNWGNGKVYIFRGSQYVRWDIALNMMEANYPMALDAAHWPGWPPAWNAGIDAAINWGNDKVYFFRKGEYLRYDIPADKVDANYPKALGAAFWPGWPAAWNSGIDAAVNWTYGQAYFFKGGNYLRYIMSPVEGVDPAGALAFNGTPFNTGWPASWNSGIDAAVVWNSGYLGVGNYVILQHVDGTFGVYWHFQKDGVRVKVGDQVERGDWIGSSGATGNASTAHLHMDVRPNWDYGYPANKSEYKSIPVRFEDQNHVCWVPRVGQTLASDNS
jgi:murein DD-endopeptidase MepM/ murein hydrolase activator NlpD